ncbi:Pre-mRNA-splicing regulator female-lethal(2)D [Eumeta japonica]|uniref:Pre-mRNA-splicing regulator female-lethal(2)D n=1 Tax=Eumeta variegata TaxID=151549 RepID=A0A4C1T8U4_EUMVA|nr:Pre-mRNA-splicing regulator female-lethal(2)D [Eumeta japonica]
MTMDDQRPLMNSYDKMSKQYEQNLHNTARGVGGGSGLVVNNAGILSGPASPTSVGFRRTHYIPSYPPASCATPASSSSLILIIPSSNIFKPNNRPQGLTRHL